MSKEGSASEKRRLDGFESRLKAIETRTEGKRPFTTKLATSGVFVGCVSGVFAALYNIFVMFQEINASPKLEVSPKKVLRINWIPDKHLLKAYWGIRVTNKGKAHGTLEDVKPRLTVKPIEMADREKSEEAIEPIQLKVQEDDEYDVHLPFTVLPSSKHELNFVIDWKLTEKQLNELFLKSGLRELILDFTPSSSNTYCFFASSVLITQAQTVEGSRFKEQDPRCS